MGSKRVSIPKISRPKLVEVVSRRRLFRLIDQKRKRPIIWITGPAGSGKTTLIADYLDDQQLPCLWYQIDKGDGEIASFFYYMGLAAKKAAPRKKGALPVLTPEYLLDIETFTKRYFENLFSRLKLPFVIVFDNWQDIPGQSMLHEIICEGLIGIPEGITLIFASREEPPSVMARLMVNHNIEFIDWEQLRFTEDESKKILRLHDENRLSEETMRKIHTITKGWAAGLILIQLRAQREHIESQLPDHYSLTEIFAYFVTEIFKKIDEPKEDFLLKTAYLPKITPETAENLTGNKQAKSLLSQLASTNCFTEKRYNPTLVYLYHPLFREFLLERVKDKFSQTEISQLKYKAAQLLDASGQIEDAAELYSSIDAWAKLAQLILRQAPIMLQQGRNQTLERWIKYLPDTLCKKIPWLYYWMGVSLCRIHPIEAVDYFEKAYWIFKREKNYDGLFLSLSDIMDCYIYEHNHMPLLEPWLIELKDLSKNYSYFPSIEIEARVVSTMFLCLLAYVPETLVDPQISELAKRLEQLTEYITNCDDQMMIGNFLIHYYCFRGDFSKAALLLEEVKQNSSDKNTPPLTIIIARFVEVIYCCFTGHFTRCQKVAEEGLEIVKHSGVHIFEPLISYFAINSALLASDFVSATKFLNKMASSFNKFQDDSYWGAYQYLVGWKAWLENDCAKALEHLKRCLLLSQKTCESRGLPKAHLGLAHLLTECGKYRQAAFHLTQARRVIKRNDNNFEHYKWLLVKAQLAFKKDNKKNGLLYLKKALAFSRETGIVFIDFIHPSITAQLCLKALEAGIEIDHTREIIRQLKLVPGTPPLDCELWPWPYQIYTLGRFSVLKDGEPLLFSGKVQKKPLQMLKALISFGGRDIKNEIISDVLWPDANGDMALRAFNTTLYRLRKLLGNEQALLLTEGNLSIDSRYCWVDIFAFERILKQADTAYTEGMKDEAMFLFNKALALYHGPFLSSDQGQSWSLVSRDRLQKKYIRSIKKLGQYLEDAGKINSAIECFQKGIEADTLVEEFYQQLILCLQRLGRNTEAVAIYQSCKKNLATTLGINPSRKTQNIYKSIR